MISQNIIIKPVITEKSMQDAGFNRFTFMVCKTADKTAIKREVEKKFNVNVINVLTNIVKGRKKRAGARRTEIEEPVFKKAIVKIKAGQKIALFDVAQGQT